MGWIRSCVAATLVALASATFASAQQTVELRNGKWQNVTTRPTTSASATGALIASPELDLIESLINKEQYKVAIKRQIKWFHSHKGSPVFDRGLFLMARALYGYGDRLKAFYYCDELMDEYPASPLFYKALNLQYQIANAYLDGYKRRIF